MESFNILPREAGELPSEWVARNRAQLLWISETVEAQETEEWINERITEAIDSIDVEDPIARGPTFRPETYGAEGDVVFFADGKIEAGENTITSASFTADGLPGGAGSKNIHIGWAGSGGDMGVTSGSTGVSYTSVLPRSSGPAIPSDCPILISYGDRAQLFECSSAALNGDINVRGQTPIFDFPAGSDLSIGNVGLGCAADGTPTTITSMDDGSAVISANAVQTVEGIMGWYGTDDTEAFTALFGAMDDVGGVISLEDRFYLLDGDGNGSNGLNKSENGNAIVAIPEGNVGTCFSLLGTAGFNPLETTALTNAPPGASGFATTRIADIYSVDDGPPSLIGAATDEARGDDGWPSSGTLIAKDITFFLPENPAIGALDCQNIANAVIDRVWIKTPGSLYANYGGDGPTYTYPWRGIVPDKQHQFGIRFPGTTNQGMVTGDSCGVYGCYASYVITEHADLRSCFAQFGTGGLCLTPTGLGSHLNQVHKFGAFNTKYMLSFWSPDLGMHSPAPGQGNYIVGTFNTEIGVAQWEFAVPSGILDANDGIVGEILVHPMSFLGIASTIPQGGTKLKIRHTDPTRQSPDLQVFTADGTWTRPAGARKVNITCIGGGGGGWSGGRGGPGVAVDGGQGGGGGAYSQQTIDANQLSDTVAVTVGGSQPGEPGRTTDGGPNWAQLAGETSSFGTFVLAGGGSVYLVAGAGMTPGGIPGYGGVGAAVGEGGDIRSAGITSGGGGGGGIGVDNVSRAGGNGGATPLLSGGAKGTAGNDASDGLNNSDPDIASGGSGGGGGGSDAAGVGGNGGDGGRYGGGGGGGGASRTGANSGAGGTGAAGIVIVFSE